MYYSKLHNASKSTYSQLNTYSFEAITMEKVDFALAFNTFDPFDCPYRNRKQPGGMAWEYFAGEWGARDGLSTVNNNNNTDCNSYWIHNTMSLWLDKYRPTSLGKLDYHKELAAQLKNLVS